MVMSAGAVLVLAGRASPTAPRSLLCRSIMVSPPSILVLVAESCRATRGWGEDRAGSSPRRRPPRPHGRVTGNQASGGPETGHAVGIAVRTADAGRAGREDRRQAG